MKKEDLEKIIREGKPIPQEHREFDGMPLYECTANCLAIWEPVGRRIPSSDRITDLHVHMADEISYDLAGEDRTLGGVIGFFEVHYLLDRSTGIYKYDFTTTGGLIKREYNALLKVIDKALNGEKNLKFPISEDYFSSTLVLPGKDSQTLELQEGRDGTIETVDTFDSVPYEKFKEKVVYAYRMNCEYLKEQRKSR